MDIECHTSGSEGVIQYTLQYQANKLEAPKCFQTLNVWRHILFILGLMGQDENRYGGLAYGNVSHRLLDGENQESLLIISGTQTSQLAETALDHYAILTYCNPEANVVHARGLVKPSSEAMTHAALYQCDPKIQCVFHVHSPILWRAQKPLNLHQTPVHVSYGTPQMTKETRRLIQEKDLGSEGVMIMGGHEDGVIAFGHSPLSTGLQLVSKLNQAESLLFKNSHQ